MLVAVVGLGNRELVVEEQAEVVREWCRGTAGGTNTGGGGGGGSNGLLHL
jgi:hypothetical protein